MAHGGASTPRRQYAAAHTQPRARGRAHPERRLWRYELEDRPKHTFEVLPRRWVVERIYGAMSRLMRRRLTRAAA